jgi:pyridoxamine 5'-phosphate oxidase-like protein
MATKQGSFALLDDPIAQELLRSTSPARLAYIWRDGTPRVIPIWFHWTGKEIVLGTPLKAPKVQALSRNAKVALSIDSNTWPYKVLQIRGTARVETVAGVVPEYALAAERYFGQEQGQTWVKQVGGMFPQMARITIQPEWVAVLDFEKRFPSAIEAAMSG